jgi:hypothetical protein
MNCKKSFRLRGFVTDMFLTTHRGEIQDNLCPRERRKEEGGGYLSIRLSLSRSNLSFCSLFSFSVLWIMHKQPLVAGLPLWIQRDAPLLDEDVVLWYVLGVTHEPRLEDWPVMPVEHTGLHFKPCG